MASDRATGEVAPRLATGAQLWRLNQLGLLSEALGEQSQVPAERAREMLWDAARRGLWEPRPKQYLPVGMEQTTTHERLRLERARRARARAADDVGRAT